MSNHLVAVFSFELLHYILEVRCEIFKSLVVDFFRDAEECLCNEACDAAERVRVTTNADGVSYAVLEVRAVEESHYRLWHSVLTGGSPSVAATDAVACEGKVISEFLFDGFPDFLFCRTLA